MTPRDGVACCSANNTLGQLSQGRQTLAVLAFANPGLIVMKPLRGSKNAPAWTVVLRQETPSLCNLGAGILGYDTANTSKSKVVTARAA